MPTKRNLKALHVYLEDGTPQGPISVDLQDAALKVMSLGLNDVKQHTTDQMKKGFYLLIEAIKLDDRPELFSVYAGESNQIAKRVTDHITQNTKSFERVVLAYTTDSSFTKDHAQFIERQLIEFLNQHPLVLCTNRDSGQGGELSRFQQHLCMNNLDNFALIVSALGFWFMQDWGLSSQELSDKYAVSSTPVKRESSPQSRLSISSESLEAVNIVHQVETASLVDDPFKDWPVFEFIWRKRTNSKGYLKVMGVGRLSLLPPSDVNSIHTPTIKRSGHHGTYIREILDNGTIKVQDDIFQVVKPIESKSPAALCALCNGRGGGGWKVWKTPEDETLDDFNKRMGNPLGRPYTD